ncbi:hypothetical protein ACFLW0_02090 [Chloroflexota bacterium]
MKLTNDVKNLATGMGADLIGVAPIDRFENAPEEGKPQYFMHDAECVIVLATRILEGMCDVHGSYEEEGKTIGPYMWYGYPMLNWANSWIAIQVGKLLEDNGYRALPFAPAGFHYRHPEEGRADFSHRHAAVAAGLGEFGLNGLFLSPQFGAHQRLLSIITSAPLDPDPMYEGTPLCNRKECKDLCIKICPMKAFEDKTVSVRIGNKDYEYTTLNRTVCLWHSIYGKYLRGNEELPRYPDKQQIEELMAGPGGRAKLMEKANPWDKALQQFTFVPTCGTCLIKCPTPQN